MTVVIGLTGGIASGKSTVSRMFRELGIPVVDADSIAREVVEPGKEAYKHIVAQFGEGILQGDGTINRVKLGNIIFSNEDKRLLLNSTVHPAVRTEMNMQKEQYIQEGHVAVVLDIPLLFESKLTSFVEKILLVYVDADVQLERLMERNGLTIEEAQTRITSQIPLSQKVALADEVINNNGTIEETKLQLICILQKWYILN